MEFNNLKEDLLKEKTVDPYGFIYITTNMVNGMKYIGQKIFNNNWKGYLGSGVYFSRALKKYGKENFYREIIAIAYSKEELNKLEIEYIKNHSAVENNDYYNISYGGDSVMLGRKHSKESRKKMSKTHTGKILSKETKRKLSEITKGKNHYLYGKHPSEETKRKLSEAKKGDKNNNYNKPRSEETKRKISESNQGKKVSDKTRLKQSESKKGNKNYNYGKKQSIEVIEKRTRSRIRLNENQIKKIREKYMTGEYTHRQLAKEYSVSQTMIKRIINREGIYNKI